MSFPRPEAPDDDLVSLGADPKESQITAKLNDRFSKENIYTKIGESILVAVNPYRQLDLNSDESAREYGNAVKDGSDRGPHIFETAASAYYNMLRSKQDQSIMFLGESGSGKTEAYKLALKSLVAISKSKKKEEKISDRVIKTNVVLESFGHAKTAHNDNASRFGKNVELQFSSRGKLSGMKLSDYLLENTRVTDVPYEERTFHVFYQLLAGANSEEKDKWNLHSPSHYGHLIKSKTYKISGVDDAAKFYELKAAFSAIGIKDKYQQQVFQLLATILNLCNIEFALGEHKDEAAEIKNPDLLEIIADMLGVRPANLENALVYKTKLIKKEICTIFLDPEEAYEQRNTLCRTLYSLLWSWLIESINKKLCEDEPASSLSLVDLFGIENLKVNHLHQVLYNFTAEKQLAFFNETIFDREIEKYRNENVPFPEVSYGDNTKILDLFTGKPKGLFSLMEGESSGKKKGKISKVIEEMNEAHSNDEFYISFAKKSKNKLFGIRHHSEDVHYDAKEFMETNTETIVPDFVTLFRGDSDVRPSRNTFIAGLFSDKILHLENAPQNADAVVNAMQINVPRRKPNPRHSKVAESPIEKDASLNFISRYRASLEELFQSVQDSQVSFVLCVRGNHSRVANRFEVETVKNQISHYNLPDVIRIRSQAYNLHESFDAFAERFRLLDASRNLKATGNTQESIKSFFKSIGMPKSQVAYGNNEVFLGEKETRDLLKQIRVAEKEERRRIKAKVAGTADLDSQVGSRVSSYIPDDGQSDFSEEESRVTANYSDGEYSDAGSEYSEYSYISGMTAFEKEGVPDANEAQQREVELAAEEEVQEMSPLRKKWLLITWLLTWWIPTKCLEWNGMKRSDIQQAWREKVALCILIALLSGIMLFFIAGFSLVMCPNYDMNTWEDVKARSDPATEMWLGVHGLVWDWTTLRLQHSPGKALVEDYAGKDATDLFPRHPDLCDPPIEEDGDPFKPGPYYGASWGHDAQPTLPYFDKVQNKKFWKGYVAYTKTDVATNHANPKSYWIIVDNNVYDMTNYRNFSQSYYGPDVTKIVNQYGGQDCTQQFKAVGIEGSIALACMKRIQFVGVIDTRDSPQCIFANSLLLAATGVLVGIMVVKFLAALQLGSLKSPEEHDRFVICQIPCYTEGEESLRRTLDSIATLKYDDKRKLILIVADGNIVGSGNDRATWRIALDLLGVDSSIDPPKLSFLSLGEGSKQHNMGKVYTGLYDCTGHLVPFMVVVKVGKDNETRRPGNRGKRDSQMLLMRFLQKVHYDEPLAPLELEMYHQMKNVIGVDPSFYEFVLMVDADTEVTPDSLNRMVSCMVNDSKILGLCGETALANEKESWITMIQVYEYYISHVLAKAFESLFGSVTCLPGCFCMYRIRTPNKSIPLLIAKPIIQDYSVNDVDTLHKKNLLSLGEDRYLTTLMLKHFPNMKISFTQDAHCKTYAPDRWSVLLSQRRRWINSTVHNLAELLLLPQLCGFCCFSMRFVAFFDLFATLVMPASIGYLGYLIYMVAIARKISLPVISLILLAAAYGLQVIIFLLKRRWEHIGWMIIYILAIPLFGFFIPLYAFWHFDDFSWGNTRVVVGEKGGKKQIVDEEPFDPNSIPMKKWTDYESEVWERESQLTGSAAPSQYTGMIHPQSQQQLMQMNGSQISYMHPPPMYAGPPMSSNQSVLQPSAVAVPISPAQRPMSVQSSHVPLAATAGSDAYPTDEQLISQIKTILSTANLMTVTKKQVRDELSLFFGVDLNPRKEFINKVIEDVLQGRM